MGITENYFKAQEELHNRIMEINTICCNIDVNEEFWRDISGFDIEYSFNGNDLVIQALRHEPYGNHTDCETYWIPKCIVDEAIDFEIVDWINKKIENVQGAEEQRKCQQVYFDLKHNSDINNFTKWCFDNPEVYDSIVFNDVYKKYLESRK